MTTAFEREAEAALVKALRSRGCPSISLVFEGLEQCRKLQVDAVVVLGNPKFYQRFGFAPASGFKINSVYDVDDEYFMLIELSAGALDSVEEVVRYQKEFDLT